MAKAFLEFDLDKPEDRASHTRAIKATDAYLVLWDIAQEVFRPARKHGYADNSLNDLIKDCGVNYQGESRGAEIIHQLETKFYQIMESRGVSLEDLD